MDTTMIEPRTSTPVGFVRAFAIQFRLLWQSRRPLLLGVGLLAVLALAGEPWNDHLLARFLTVWPVWVVVIGPLWGFAAFYNEGPADRLYHWSQPVSRTVHTLARLAAAIAWLWIMLALLVVAGFLAAWMDGEAGQIGALGAAAWLNYFVAPVLGFLAISVITVLSDHPLRWFLGIVFLVPFSLSILHEWLGLGRLIEWLGKPLTEEWGLGPTLVGALGVNVNEIEHALRLLTDPSHQYRTAYDVGTWWVAAPLWLLLFTGLVVLAASRHPDVLPRWRGRS